MAGLRLRLGRPTMPRPTAVNAGLLLISSSTTSSHPPLLRPSSRFFSIAAQPRPRLDNDAPHKRSPPPTREPLGSSRPLAPPPLPRTPSPSARPPPRSSRSAPLYLLPPSLTARQRSLYLSHLRRIQRCLDARLLSPALSAFAALTRSSLPPSPAAFSLLLDAATAASDAERAVSVVHRMTELGFPPPPSAYHRLVRVLCHRGRVAEAWEVLALLRPQVTTASPSLLPLLPVLPLLLERSQTAACEGRYAGEVAALRALLVDRRAALLRETASSDSGFVAVSASTLVSELRRELVFVSLALLDCGTAAEGQVSNPHASSPAEVSSVCRSLLALRRPPLSTRQTAEVYRAVISAFARLSAFDEAFDAGERWAELIRRTPHTPPTQQQSFRLAIQSLLLLSRALYCDGAPSTAATARASHTDRMQRLLALLPSSRTPLDDRTLLVALCAALPAGDTRHLTLLARLRLQLQLPAITAPASVEEDVEAVGQHRRGLVTWVMGALSKHGIHPSDDTLSLLASSLELSASTSSELEAALSALPALRSQFHVQPSYELLHSLLPDARAKRQQSLPAIPPLLRHFADSYSLPPSPHTLHLIHKAYQPTAATLRPPRVTRPAPTAPASPPSSSPHPVAHSQPLSLLLDLSRSYGQALSPSTVLSLLRSAAGRGGSAASLVASRTRREWEGLQSLEATRLALQCWMQGGEEGQQAALRWWTGRAKREEEGGKGEGEGEGEGKRVGLLALDDGVVDVMVSGLREAGDEAGAIDVAERWTKWRQWSGGREAAPPTRGTVAPASSEEAQLDAL